MSVDVVSHKYEIKINFPLNFYGRLRTIGREKTLLLGQCSRFRLTNMRGSLGHYLRTIDARQLIFITQSSKINLNAFMKAVSRNVSGMACLADNIQRFSFTLDCYHLTVFLLYIFVTFMTATLAQLFKQFQPKNWKHPSRNLILLLDF